MSDKEILVDNPSISSNKPKKKFYDNFLSKIKKIKHLDIILTVLFIAIILLIYFSSFSNVKVAQDNNNKKSENNYLVVTTLDEYSKKLEDKLEHTLGAIKDAGNISVMLNFDRGIETVIAFTTETETKSDGTVVEVKSPVLITNNGKTETVVLQEILPVPTSIVVVATGATNTNVKLEILRAVQAMFGLNTSKIEIFAGN